MAKRKNGGGNSHQRAMAHSSSVPASVTPAVHFPDRIVRIVESSSTQTLAGIVGGLVGTFLDGRYFAVLGVWASFILYRSNALEGMRRRLTLPIHIFSVALVSVALYFMGIQINKSRPHTYTPADYANAVNAGLPLPIAQQVTNIYRTVQNFGPKDKPPLMKIESPVAMRHEPDSILFNSQMTNIGGQTARDEANLAGAIFTPITERTGDEIFNSTRNQILDKDATKADMAVNVPFQIPTRLRVSPQDLADYDSGKKAVMVGVLTTYLDAQGKRYFTESCIVITPGSLNHTCVPHNRTYTDTKPQ
jgi:hypothetical protein